MANIRVTMNNFAGGETSESLSSRFDLQRFGSSLRSMENMVPELHGPMRRRMGTRFLADLGESSVVIPFQFSSDPSQNYAIILQNGKIKIAQTDGLIMTTAGGSTPVEVVTPYTAAQLYDISYSQSGDIVYLAHSQHALRKLSRYGHRDWRISTVTFSPTIQPPASASGTFNGTGGGYVLNYKISAVSDSGEESDTILVSIANAKHPSDWLLGENVTLSWAAVAGARDYNIYRQSAGTYGLVGVITDGATTFRDDNYEANTLFTPKIRENPFSENNNPGVVCFHQQRLILGATYLQPQTFYASTTGNYEDFSTSRPLRDDDMLEFTLASGRIDIIQWIAAFGDLVIGTAGSEYKAVGSDQGTITPTSINVREQSYWGSIKIKPLIIGNSILHVQRQGSRVRDLFYSLERDGYAGSDLSIMASHLFDNYFIRQWDYQQSPGSIVWCVRNDGVILSLVYMKEHQIWGWSRIITNGQFRSVCCVSGNLEDTVYFVSQRLINGQQRYYLELLEPRWFEEDGIENSFYVDAGKTYTFSTPTATVTDLSHLEGMLVTALVDGSPIASQVVQDGQITLTYPGLKIQVGLPFLSRVCPQSPQMENTAMGSTLATMRNYANIDVEFLQSVGGKLGKVPIPDEQQTITTGKAVYFDRARVPYTGFKQLGTNLDFSQNGELWFTQEDPLPFTIASITMDVSYGR